MWRHAAGHALLTFAWAFGATEAELEPRYARMASHRARQGKRCRHWLRGRR